MPTLSGSASLSGTNPTAPSLSGSVLMSGSQADNAIPAGSAVGRVSASASLNTLPSSTVQPSVSGSAVLSSVVTEAASSAKPVDIPALPASLPAELKRVLEPMREYVQTIAGRRGDDLDTAVTFRDLISSGIAQVQVGVGGRPGSPSVGPGYPPDLSDYTTPPAPTNLTTTNGVGTVFLSWGGAAFASYAYTEIWRSAANDIAQAVMVGTSVATRYADAVGDGIARYYWVRFVSKANVKGPYNGTAGTEGKPSDDPAYLIDVLSEEYGVENVADAPFFYVSQTTTINGVPIPKGTYIKSAFIGDATISSAKIKDLVANKITAGFINADVGIRTLRGYSTELYAGGTYTEVLDGAGNIVGVTPNNPTIQIVGGNATFKADSFKIFGTRQADTTITPFSVNSVGVVQMNTAVIGDGTITDAKIGEFIKSTTFNGNPIANDAGTAGWYLGKDGKFYASSVQLRGQLTAGDMTAYSWPAAGKTGAYIGPEGLLLGNYNDRGFVEFRTSTGYLSIGKQGGGVLTLSGGTLTFTGNLNAAGGTFSGTLTADAVNAVNTVNIGTDAVTIPDSAAGTLPIYITLNNCVAGRKIFIIGQADATTENSPSGIDNIAYIRQGSSTGTVLVSAVGALQTASPLDYLRSNIVMYAFTPTTGGNLTFYLTATGTSRTGYLFGMQTKR